MSEKIVIPDLLPYPKLAKFDNILETMHNKYVHVIEEYPMEGVALLILRKNSYVMMHIGDFTGKLLEKTNNIHERVPSEHRDELISMMKCVKLDKAIFYFSIGKEVLLVDMRLSINKFCSPGYLKDFFGRKVPIQKQIGDPIVLNDENLQLVRKAEGIYKGGNFIIKPVIFKTIIVEEQVLPNYGVLEHEAALVARDDRNW
jgi:hypothetical protein